VVWRSKEHLPKDLIFELHYLGSVEYSFSLNFSRPAAPIIAQYFNFVHLGFEGYRSVARDDLQNARLLSRALEKSGWYTVLSDIHRPKAEGLLQRGAQATVGLDEGNPEVRILPWVATLSDFVAYCHRTTKMVFQSCHSGSPTASRRNTLKSNSVGFRLFCEPKGGLSPTTSLPPTCKTFRFFGSLSRRICLKGLVFF